MFFEERKHGGIALAAMNHAVERKEPSHKGLSFKLESGDKLAAHFQVPFLGLLTTLLEGLSGLNGRPKTGRKVC